MSASLGSDCLAPATSSAESDRVMKKLLDGDGGSDDGEGRGVIAQCARFPIASFDRKSKGLTSIIQSLKVQKHGNQKGKIRTKENNGDVEICKGS